MENGGYMLIIFLVRNSVVTLGSATALGAIILSGAAGGFSGVLLNGGNLGQALVAGVIGGVIGGATAPRSSKGLADWLWQNFSKPELVSQDYFDNNYQNKTGIIYLAPPTGGIGHIDLWNKGQTGSGYYLATKVWFWEVK